MPERVRPLLMPDTPAGTAGSPPRLVAPESLVHAFEQRLASDAAWAKENLFLMAWLQREPSVEEAARALVMEMAASVAGPNNDALEHHTWCIATRALRSAAFATWLPWPRREACETLGRDLLIFCFRHAIPVLGGRAPSADNQYLSLSLTCAVVGEALVRLDVEAPAAATLRDFGVTRLWRWLGLMPADGYGGEGSSYQVQVVGPLVMWMDLLLRELGGESVTLRREPPNGCSLAAVLDLSHDLLSPGALLPGWDNPGWVPYSYHAPLVYRAHRLRQPLHHPFHREHWDSYDNIAWGHDDRMWTLLCWPDASKTAPTQAATSPTLTGWMRPRTAAAIDHHPTQTRLMLCADPTADAVQAVGRYQCNPNHLLYEVAGRAIFGDGPCDGPPATPYDSAALAQRLSDTQRELLVQQFGSLDRYLQVSDMGLLGRANTVMVDEQRDWFPLTMCAGQGIWEQATNAQRGYGFESRTMYDPSLNLSAARRFIVMDAQGVAWIVDDYRTDRPRRFTWQVHLPMQTTWQDAMAISGVDEAVRVTLGWPAQEPAMLTPCPEFPKPIVMTGGPIWAALGSVRLQRSVTTDRYLSATVLLPFAAEALRVIACGPRQWRATWRGGASEVSVPDLALTQQDIDAPFIMSHDELPWQPPVPAPNRAVLREADPTLWREKVLALRDAAERRDLSVLAEARALLSDAQQRYHVHSAACVYLGQVRDRASVAMLQRWTFSAEPNIAAHARAALAMMQAR